MSWRRLDGLAILCLFGAVLTLARCVSSCSPASALEETRHVVIVAGYERDLEPCRLAALDAGTIAAFDACEKKQTREVCLEHRELQSKSICAGVFDAGR